MYFCVDYDNLSFGKKMRVLEAWENFPTYIRLTSFSSSDKSIDEYIDTELDDLLVFKNTFHEYCENGKLDSRKK